MDAGLGDYPLVLHGASSVPKYLVDEINKYGGKMPDAQGVPEADIEVARRVGCTKVNIDTDLRMAMTAGIRKVFAEKPGEFDPRKYLGPARTGRQRPRPPQGQGRALLRRSRVRLNPNFSKPRAETAWGFCFWD
jgi:fructose/tagatose bisphosphate aldolase